MNSIALELYKQAIEFAYTEVGKEHSDKTFFQGVIAGKLSESIVKACADFVEQDQGSGEDLAKRLKKHFGVEE